MHFISLVASTGCPKKTHFQNRRYCPDHSKKAACRIVMMVLKVFFGTHCMSRISIRDTFSAVKKCLMNTSHSAGGEHYLANSVPKGDEGRNEEGKGGDRDRDLEKEKEEIL